MDHQALYQLLLNLTGRSYKAYREVQGYYQFPEFKLYIDYVQADPTTHFSTTNASGSTAQASNVIEALEADATVLLIDEDTSATNFMIRDRRMQALVAKDHKPITPFIDKVRQLYQSRGVSTLLVMGGSGDYFDVADTIIAMTNYQPHEVTNQAKTIAAQYPTARLAEGGTQFGVITPRLPLAKALSFAADASAAQLKVRARNQLIVGTETIVCSRAARGDKPGAGNWSRDRLSSSELSKRDNCHE